MKKTSPKEKSKRFAPLQRYEDRQHALYLSIGAIITVIGFLCGKYL